jgi:hypothetical protein
MRILRGVLGFLLCLGVATTAAAVIVKPGKDTPQGSNVPADVPAFELDVSYVDAKKRLGKDTFVHELAVKEEAFVDLIHFCDEDGPILIGTATVREPVTLSTMAKVTVLPGNQVDMTLVPAKGQNTQDAIDDVLSVLFRPCSRLSEDLPSPREMPPFKVRLINGSARLSNLLP